MKRLAFFGLLLLVLASLGSTGCVGIAPDEDSDQPWNASDPRRDSISMPGMAP